MDPITAAIMGALTTGMASGLSDIAKTAITSAYDKLKTLLLQKCGGTGSDVASALKEVEAKPESKGRQATLQEELTAVHAHQDKDLLQAAQELLQLIQSTGAAGPHVQIATGSYIAQADRGSSASVRIIRPE